MIYKLIVVFVLFLPAALAAQQIAKAADVQLVLEPGTFINASGGLCFTGTANFINNGTVNFIPAKISQNWMDSTATGVLDNTGTGLVHFNGDSIHQLYGNTRFYNLRVNTDSSLNLLSNIEVKNQLNLDKGLITTNAFVLQVSSPALNAIQSASGFSNSWINGKLKRVMNISGTDYLFPVGKRLIPDSFYAPVKIDKFNSNNASYTAAYFRATPIDYTNFLNPPIDHVSQIEYWEVQSSDFAAGADDDAKLSLSWRGGSVVSSNPLTRDSLLITQYTSFPRWEATGTISAIVNPVSGTGAFGFVKHLGYIGSFNGAEKQFTLASRSPYNILPYLITNWTAAAIAEKVQLQWDISFEQDVKSYTIEKSLTGNGFIPIGTKTAGKLSHNRYLFFDEQPQSGWNYYQLKIVQESGKVGNAGIRKLWFGEPVQKISFFPNPVNNNLLVQLPVHSGSSEIQIFDATGKKLIACQLVGSSLQIPCARLKPGAYFLKFVQGNQVYRYRFIKQ